MNVDYSFIRLTKNDFEVAKKGDNPNIATLIYDGFIMQLPNETFTQKTNNDDGIAFAGGISVDLIDKCGLLVQNIDSNFYYESRVDENGVNQIEFEFGMIGQNYFTMPLYLRITDQINGNIFYSNGFLVTDYYSQVSTRFDYKNANDTIIKSVRIANCFHDTQVNKLDLKSYTTTKGFQTSYGQIPTYLQKYTIETLDFFANNRLVDLFSHSVIYVNSMRCSVSDYKTEDRKGTTNVMSAEFTINPLNEIYNWSYQIYQGLQIVDILPLNGGIYTLANFSPIVLSGAYLIFNKTITSVNGKYKLYKDNVYVAEFDLTFAGLAVGIDLASSGYTFVNGNYSIVMQPNQIVSGVESFQGFALNEWTFTIADGEFDNTEFDTDFLIN